MKSFKTFLEESRKAMLAALALTSAAMAAPPKPEVTRTPHRTQVEFQASSTQKLRAN